MFARINKTTRSKPMAVIRPAPSGTPSIPGMLTPPRITRDGADYVFTDGTYAGMTGRTRAYLLDGVNVSGRVSGGRFTPAPADAGKLLSYHETITGSGGGITRQASDLVRSRDPLLSDFYGIGPGQIPMDLRLDDPAKMILSGALIQAVTNDGGAGAVFNANAAVGEEPSLPVSGPAGADFSQVTAGARRLTMANPADLQGVHFLCPFTVPTGSSVGFVASGPDGFTMPAFRSSSGNLSIRVGNNVEFPHITTAQDMFIGNEQWALLEIRIAAGRFQVWMNGALRHNLACSTAAHPITVLGSGSTAANRWTSRLGRLISIVAADATTAYPAVLLARQTLAARYGITLA